jgi:hypothetical protein
MLAGSAVQFRKVRIELKTTLTAFSHGIELLIAATILLTGLTFRCGLQIRYANVGPTNAKPLVIWEVNMSHGGLLCSRESVACTSWVYWHLRTEQDAGWALKMEYDEGYPGYFGLFSHWDYSWADNEQTTHYRDRIFPVGYAALALIPLTAIRPLVRWRRQRRERQGLCVRCRYNLTGNQSGVCPECGTPIGSPLA